MDYLLLELLQKLTLVLHLTNENAKANLAQLIKDNFKGKVVFVIGENGLNLAQDCKKFANYKSW